MREVIRCSKSNLLATAAHVSGVLRHFRLQSLLQLASRSATTPPPAATTAAATSEHRRWLVVAGAQWLQAVDSRAGTTCFCTRSQCCGKTDATPTPFSPHLHDSEEGVRNQERERELRRVSTPDNDSLENLSAPLPTFPTSVSAVCALMYLTAAEDGGGKGMKAV